MDKSQTPDAGRVFCVVAAAFILCLAPPMIPTMVVPWVAYSMFKKTRAPFLRVYAWGLIGSYSLLALYFEVIASAAAISDAQGALVWLILPFLLSLYCGIAALIYTTGYFLCHALGKRLRILRDKA